MAPNISVDTYVQRNKKMAIDVPIWSLYDPAKRRVGCECVSANTVLYQLQLQTHKDSQKRFTPIYTVFKNIDRNVKFYQSTEKCPLRALHNLVT